MLFIKFHPSRFLCIAILAGLFANAGLLAQLPEAGEALVEFDATWAYHDGNEDLEQKWQALEYDDSTWKQGSGFLGYDTRNRADRWPEPGLQTRLQESLITYYFRAEFDYAGSTERQRLIIDQVVDDAAVYYLNGVEVARSELIPEGTINFNTRATSATDPWNKHEILTVDNAPLREGRNVLAVSVHNQSTGSSDICLGVKVSVAEMKTPPIAMYLSWQRDPTTTMTVQWHTEGETGSAALQYGSIEGDDLQVLPAESHPMPYSDRLIHTVEIIGLEPGSEYHFRLSNTSPGVQSPLYKFRTMPSHADKPIRIAVGGDIQHQQKWMEQVNREAMRFDPDFMVWGGDLAYADGKEERLFLWYTFFDAMMDTLITDDGRVVPVLMGIGNHEILGGYYWGNERGHDAYEDSDAFRESIAPYYYSLFAFPGHPGYGHLDFGDYLSLIFLDTDHSGPIAGAQTEWLTQVIAERENVPHLFPISHFPAYPSVRPFESNVSARIREHWIPLYEAHGVRVAFENHDHAYKRTVPIREGKEDPGGVVYIGDGAWGVAERVPHAAADVWYLEKSQSMRHFILVTIQGDSQDFKMISREGKLIDHYISPQR
jgi:hypothetical protein